MKRIFASILVVSIIFILTSCSKAPKEKVFSIVEKNYDTILTACKEKDADKLLSIKGIEKVNIIDGYVVVFCIGKGISVSSQDYGFYYSEENIPVTIDCNQEIVCDASALKLNGNSFECVVSGNTFYTERIKDNVYFYSNAY